MSTGTFSAENTFSVVGPILNSLFPRLGPIKVAAIHGLIRKGAHGLRDFRPRPPPASRLPCRLFRAVEVEGVSFCPGRGGFVGPGRRVSPILRPDPHCVDDGRGHRHGGRGAGTVRGRLLVSMSRPQMTHRQRAFKRRGREGLYTRDLPPSARRLKRSIMKRRTASQYGVLREGYMNSSCEKEKCRHYTLVYARIRRNSPSVSCFPARQRTGAIMQKHLRNTSYT